MDYNAYEFLGLTPSATREEVDERYKTLRQKYQRDRFLTGEDGEEAAEKLQQLEIAYRDIMANLSAKTDAQDFGDGYGKIQRLIKDGKLDEAQDLLDNADSRDAEWHYLQSVIFYKRNWFLESKKQLEFALQIEPDNQRYKDSLDKLVKILASNSISPDQLRTTSRPVSSGPSVGSGNGTCTGTACGDCLLANACCNCASCMCGR
ncbi:MAG: hypothetical protein NC350_00265 [Corallococcus sp.]|nr:hypothetical protein [Corallococcus sp.]